MNNHSKIIFIRTFLYFGIILFIFNITIHDYSAFSEESTFLTLADAVDNALIYNKEIKVAYHEKEAARNAKLEAVSSYLPHLSFQSEFTRTESDRYTSPFQEAGFSGEIYNNKIEVSQLIFNRSVISNIFLADLKKETAELQLIGQKQQTVFDTINLYIEILRAEEIINVQTQRLELAEKQLQTAHSKFEAGYHINTDVARAQLTKASSARDINIAKVAMERAQVYLNQRMGLSVELRHSFKSDYLTTFDPSSMDSIELNAKDSLFAIAEKQNPAIQIAQLLVQQQEESVKIAKGEFYPSLSATGSWGYYDTDKLNWEDEEWLVQLVAEIPIFEGGRRIGKLQRTLEQLNAETNRYENVVLDIHGEIEEAFFVMREAKNNFIIAVQAEKVAQKNYQVFFDLYESGMAESLDLIKALTDLVGAQTEIVISRYNYLRGMAQLLSALGALPVEHISYLTNEWIVAQSKLLQERNHIQ
ncbi:MAG: TolC family protein [Desulfobacteraceae bacterium]|nr:TolC family protein [Desulfobacteraceae bacterium]MBC2755131.1 TolC family protein [Desulfobacteraceae bacterium]